MKNAIYKISLSLLIITFLFTTTSFAQCNEVNFSINDDGPCQFQLTYDNSSECYIEIRLTLEQGSFDTWSINASDGFTIQVISTSELWIHHIAGFIPLGYHEPLLFKLPENLTTPMYVGYLNDCPPGVGCELFPAPVLEACTSPQTAAIIGTVYTECGGLPYEDQPVLADWLIELRDSTGNVIDETFTGNNGQYAFFDLALGSYIVTEIVEQDWIPNVPVNGEANVTLSTSEEVTKDFGNCLMSCFANFTFQTNGCGYFSFFGVAAGIAPFTYSWDFGDTGSGTNNYSNSPIPTHQFSTSGPHTVMLSIVDVNGCTALYSNVINAPTLLSISITANPGLTICQGQTSTFTANGGPGSTYVWNNTNTTQSNLVGVADTYCVTVTDINGCTTSTCATLTVTPLPKVIITGNTSICQGGSTTLTASGGGTYVWSPGGMTTNTITVSPSNTTTYTVLATLNGCTNMTSETVSVFPLPVAQAGVDQSICKGNSAVLNGTASGGNPPYAYSWNPGNLSGAPVNTGILLNTTTFTFQVIDANGCSGTDQEVVFVKPVPIVYAGPDITICPGEFANLNATTTGGTPTYLYTWNHWWQLNPYAVTTGMNQTYTVVVTDANGCSATDQLEVKVEDCCHSSIIQNWDFSNGIASYGYDDITSAGDWRGIWTDGPLSNRTGDFWDLANSPASPYFSPLPLTPICYGNDPYPASQGQYAGFMCHYSAGSQGKVFRQGILNKLIHDINPNTGFYKVSLKIACPCKIFGTPQMAVYGVRKGFNSSILSNGPSGVIPSNGYLFGTPTNPAAKELGTIHVPNSQCDDEFDTYYFVFNSNILSGPIDRIFFTRKDVIAGSTYLAVDDVCVEKVDDVVGNYCDCGPVASAFIYQQGNNVYRHIRCGEVLNLPCSKTAYNTSVHVNFPCSSVSCLTSNIISWELNGPAGIFTGTELVTTYNNSFNINLLPSYFASTGGTYTLTFSRQCGTKKCKCTMTLKLAACACVCDDDFRLAVNQGYSVTGPGSSGSCSKILKPLGLCANDVVTWYVGSGGTYGPTTGNNPQQIPFTGPGSYSVCMSVRRFVNNNECGVRENCRTVNLSCGNDPNGTIYKSCTINQLKNGDFVDTATVSGLLGEFGNLPDWDLADNYGDGQVIVDDISGADDPGHILLVGGNENIAGFAQEISLDTNTELTLSYALKNYSGAETPAGSKLIIRLQSNTFPDADYQTLYEQEIDSSFSDWTRYELTLSTITDTSLTYLVFSLTNTDTSQRTTIGLDNVEACTNNVVKTIHASTEIPFQLYPNPASTSLFVNLPGLTSKHNELQVVNIIGEIVLSREIDSRDRYTLDIARLAPGIYFVQLLSENMVLGVSRFVKQ